jgi:hypothetical protein
MAAHAGGRTWTRVEKPEDLLKKTWRTADGELVAVYRSQYPLLLIGSRKYNEHLQAAQKPAGDPKPKGF